MPVPQHSPVPARVGLSAAAALLALVVVWAAERAVAPTALFHDPQVIATVQPVPSPSPTPSPSPSATPSSSPATSRSSARRPSPSRALVASSAATSRSAATTLTVTVSVPASWEQGYVASVRVRNTGTKPVTWTVAVTHSNQPNLTLSNTWGATGKQSGETLTFTGGPLAAGQAVTWGYQVSKTGTGNAHPAACTVVGGTCAVS